MTDDSGTVAIVGAGPTGVLLAILLRRRGLRVTVYDTRPDPRRTGEESGRSINLALAARGIRALQRVGVYDALRNAMVPMRARVIHDRAGGITRQPYGSRPDEAIYSISRGRLGRELIDIAQAEHGVRFEFEHRLQRADFDTGIAHLSDLRRGSMVAVPMQPLIGCDGAGSQLRRSLRDARLIDVREEELAHGYKELSIPAGDGGGNRLEREALHIWPRGGYMLIALPNDDGSFTATLFLPNHGNPGFDTLTQRETVARFLEDNFPDAWVLMPDGVREFLAHPTGFLGTVHAAPWQHRGMAVLVGDSAHAIVPFHGQGMNCCLEDCLAFDACIERHETWEARFNAFYDLRKENTEAIASMALENYLEMRERVADPGFQLQSALSRELERRHPDRFIPRYSMVMFHPEIPYRLAASRGLVQSRLLTRFAAHASSIEEIDFAAARRDIEAELPPIDQDLSSVMKL